LALSGAGNWTGRDHALGPRTLAIGGRNAEGSKRLEQQFRERHNVIIPRPQAWDVLGVGRNAVGGSRRER
jgi:hypothetical protein